MINEILESTEFGDSHNGEVGINRLITEEVITAAFPLHDGDSDYVIGQIVSNTRTTLKTSWSNYSMWYKHQPINIVRDYFGEKIGLYFAWLGAYTTFLIIPSIVGLIVFLINFFTRQDDSTYAVIINVRT